jgi:predicted esterase
MVVLVLPGGPQHGTARCRWWFPQVLRCRMAARAVARRWPGRRTGPVAVYLLRYAWTGWDGDGRDAVADATWALQLIRQRHPAAAVALLGHSMGARVAVRVAATGSVIGVVGLAPWLPATDAVAPLAGRSLTVVQGSRDRELPTPATDAFCERAAAAGTPVHRRSIRGGGHAMVFRMATWSRLATAALVELLRAGTRPDPAATFPPG